MKSFFLMVVLCSISSVHAGVHFALGGGLMFSAAEVEKGNGFDENDDSSSGLGMSTGARVLIDLSESVLLRSGLILQNRFASYSYDDGTYKDNVHKEYLATSIPLNLQWNINQKFHIYGGYMYDFNSSESCSEYDDKDDCELTDLESSTQYTTFGFGFTINDLIDIDTTYQHALSESFDRIKVHAITAQIFFKFN